MLVIFDTVKQSTCYFKLVFFTALTSSLHACSQHHEWCVKINADFLISTPIASNPGGGGEEGLLGLIFVGYVPLASQNPDLIIVHTVAIL